MESTYTFRSTVGIQKYLIIIIIIIITIIIMMIIIIITIIIITTTTTIDNYNKNTKNNNYFNALQLVISEIQLWFEDKYTTTVMIL